MYIDQLHFNVSEFKPRSLESTEDRTLASWMEGFLDKMTFKLGLQRETAK